MAATTEKFFAYRTDPGSGDKIGTYKYTDPITGDVIHGEQAASYGHPAKFIWIANDVSAGTTDLPSEGSVTIDAGNSLASEVTFDGNFPSTAAAADSLGLLTWYTQAATSNTNEIRKLTSVVSGNSYGVNADWSAAPTNDHTFRLLIDCFRYNAMLVKTEFSDSSTSTTCTVQPYFFSMPQDNALPTPGVATPQRYAGRQFTISNTGVSTETTDAATHYHGEVLSFGVHGAVGASLRVTAVSTGTVSIWVASV